jgi:SPP1 gp7 family putative phage head morphogenesis protein
VSVAFPKGTEKALARNLMARTKALRSLLAKRLQEVLSRPDLRPTDVAAVIAATRRTHALMAPPKVSELMNTAMGVQEGTARAVVEAVSKATGRDLSQDLRLRVGQLQREAQRVEWAQTVLAQQQRIERELFDRLERKARAALQQGQARKVLELAEEQAEQADGRLRLLARHELGNLVSTVTQQTSQALGIRRYRWLSEEDERVRELHRKLDGTIRSWDDPHPTEGHPGQAWGCRCVAQPVVEETTTPVLPEPVKPSRRREPTPEPPRTPRTPPARPQRAPRPQPAPAPTPSPTPVRPPVAPIQVPVLPPLPALPPTPVLPSLPSFAPQSLPSFPAPGSVSPLVPVPALAPPAPPPVLPKLEIPKLPKVKRAPPLRDANRLLERDYRVFTTRKAVEEYGTELAQKRQPLTREERAVVSEYTGFHYKPMNDALRAGRTHEYVPALDAAIDKAVIPHDIQVHRGIRSHPALSDMRMVKPGDVITDAGYQSTSLDRYGGFGGGILLHIKVPAGSKALWLDDLSANKGEYEVLLARGSQLQITKIEWVGGSWHVDCLLLPP